MVSTGGKKSFREVTQIVQRAYQVLRLVSRERKIALGGATLLMTLTSAGNTAVALLLGWLIDRIQRGLQQELPRETLYRSAFYVLGAISAIYLIREVMNVYRRYLV